MKAPRHLAEHYAQKGLKFLNSKVQYKKLSHALLAVDYSPCACQSHISYSWMNVDQFCPILHGSCVPRELLVKSKGWARNDTSSASASASKFPFKPRFKRRESRNGKGWAAWFPNGDLKEDQRQTNHPGVDFWLGSTKNIRNVFVNNRKL